MGWGGQHKENKKKILVGGVKLRWVLGQCGPIAEMQKVIFSCARPLRPRCNNKFEKNGFSVHT